MFKTGKFYNQIVCNIKPGEKFTSLVVNTEGLHLAGISGGKEFHMFRTCLDSKN